MGICHRRWLPAAAGSITKIDRLLTGTEVLEEGVLHNAIDDARAQHLLGPLQQSICIVYQGLHLSLAQAHGSDTHFRLGKFATLGCLEILVPEC